MNKVFRGYYMFSTKCKALFILDEILCVVVVILQSNKCLEIIKSHWKFKLTQIINRRLGGHSKPTPYIKPPLSLCVHLQNQYVPNYVEETILQHLQKELWSFVTCVYSIQCRGLWCIGNRLSLANKKIWKFDYSHNSNYSQ